MGGTIVSAMLGALPAPNVLMAAELGEDLHATAHGRGCIDKGHRAIEGSRRATGPPDVGMVGLARRKQAQGALLFGGILGMGRRCRWPLLVGDAVLLEGLFLLIPCPEIRGRLREDKAHGDGDCGGH